MRNAVLATTLLAVLSTTVAAQTTPASAPPARAAMSAAVTEAPTIDGRLDEAVWGRGQLVSGFTQREPTEGQPVSERTEVRIVHDEDALYIGAWLYDREPGGIVVGRTLRDASLGDTDAFLVIFDTYLDRQNGFVFGTTPSGIEYDGQVTDE
ncbi:MAG: carbohydrate binding family 9 domain-containing protein, partial [Longimicrobiales bacterium]